MIPAPDLLLFFGIVFAIVILPGLDMAFFASETSLAASGRCCSSSSPLSGAQWRVGGIWSPKVDLSFCCT